MSHSKLFLLTSAIADIDSALQQSTLLPLHEIGCVALQHPPPPAPSIMLTNVTTSSHVSTIDKLLSLRSSVPRYQGSKFLKLSYIRVALQTGEKPFSMVSSGKKQI